jgi:hypothetical protein
MAVQLIRSHEKDAAAGSGGASPDVPRNLRRNAAKPTAFWLHSILILLYARGIYQALQQRMEQEGRPEGQLSCSIGYR